MKAVILAAGKGVRMRALSSLYPKPLLPVLDRPVLFHQIDTCASLGITDVWVVVSPNGQPIIDAVGAHDLGVNVHFATQSEPLGISHAVGTVEEAVDSPFLLFLGDVFYASRKLERMLAMLDGERLDGVLAVTREPDPEAIKRNYSALLREDGLVERVIEKPKEIVSPLKGCGIYLFRPTFFEAVRQTERSSMRNEYELTDSIQIFINRGARVAVAEAIEWDINLTNPRDLLVCNQRLLEARGLSHFVADSARVEPSARVERSVIGTGAVVEAGCTVEDSVILANARVQRDLKGVIATVEGIIEIGSIET